jgi:hypothetical protein
MSQLTWLHENRVTLFPILLGAPVLLQGLEEGWNFKQHGLPQEINLKSHHFSIQYGTMQASTSFFSAIKVLQCGKV